MKAVCHRLEGFWDSLPSATMEPEGGEQACFTWYSKEGVVA
jgi:hypothetical protein